MVFALCAAPQVSYSEKEPVESIWLNLSFEIITPEGYPANWYIEGDAASSSISVAIAEDAVDKNKVAAVTIAGNEPVYVYTSIPPSSGCIKEIEIGVAVSGDGEVEVSAFFLTPGGLGIDISQSVAVTAEWKRVRHRKTAAECLETAPFIGVQTTGKGVARFDDVQLKINGASIGGGSVPDFSITKYDLQELNEILLPLTSLDGSADIKDARAAVTPLSGRKIIGLGENSHGSEALFKIKHRLIQTLILEGARTVAIEMPAAAADTVDAYVAGGSMDRDHVIRMLVYPSWQTVEMMAIIDWLRIHNESVEEKITFAGFDVQQPQIAIRRLGEQSSITQSPDLLGPYQEMVEAFGTGDIEKSLVASNALHKELDPGATAAHRYLRLFIHGILMDRPDLGGKSSDAYMAQEVSILASEKNEPVILWADNTHVTKTPGAMGHYLNDAFGSQYTAVGFTFGDGFYAAYGPAKRYPVETPFPGTHEAFLAAAKEDIYLVAVSSLRASHPLRQRRGFRYIGSRPAAFSQFFPHVLEHHFDVIGFVRKTEATEYLLDPSF
jgi:erythromycin esterase